MNNQDLKRALELLRRGHWKDAHEIVQSDEESTLSCWAHGIVHLMEGDLENARYWYRAAKRPFPENPSVTAEIESLSASLKR